VYRGNIDLTYISQYTSLNIKLLRKNQVIKRFSQSAIFPYFTLLVFFVPLLLFNGEQQSLMAHDEGYYALQARWIWEKGDWVTVQWWGEPAYDRTIGTQWLIALCYGLFGINETSARLPSIIASTLSILLTYKIGCILTNRRIAWLGCLVLAVTPLWLQYSRMAGQDAVLVFLQLLGIWALLEAENSHRLNKLHRLLWGILAGSTFGLGYLIKGFMILLFPIALLPYLISKPHTVETELIRSLPTTPLKNPGIYIGLILGAIPVLAWFWASWLRYGALPFQQLFGKLLYLGTADTYNPGPLYYLWNIPANAFPWPLFSLIGAVLFIRKLIQKYYKKNTNINTYNRPLLLLGYPLIFFLLLSVFKTRTLYYPLQLMPFMALFAGSALDWFVSVYQHRQSRYRWLGATLSYSFSGLGMLLILATIVINLRMFGVNVGEDIRAYSNIALIVGCGWLLLGFFWWYGNKGKNLHKLSQQWLATWLIVPWFAFASLGLWGFLGNRAPSFRTDFFQPTITKTLNAHPINFVLQESLNGEEQKTLILLSFYTPKLGGQFKKLSQLPPSSYVWTSPNIPLESSPNYQILGNVKEWRLVNIKISGD
jgi:4-amino-4-deoxy-L-arabinose transferase-like glycosyltransferase